MQLWRGCFGARYMTIWGGGVMQLDVSKRVGVVFRVVVGKSLTLLVSLKYVDECNLIPGVIELDCLSVVELLYGPSLGLSDYSHPIPQLPLHQTCLRLEQLVVCPTGIL